MPDDLSRPTHDAPSGHPIAPAPGEGRLPDGASATETPALGARFGIWRAGFSRPVGPYIMVSVAENGQWHIRPAAWDERPSYAPPEHTMRVPPMPRGRGVNNWQADDEVCADGGYFGQAVPRRETERPTAPRTDDTTMEQSGP